MTLFKQRQSQEEPLSTTRLVGVHLPRQVVDYLNLFVLAKGITKSFVVRKEIQKWHKEVKYDSPEEDLVHDLINQIKVRRRVNKTTGDAVPLAKFRKVLRNELRRKGIAQNHITEIIDSL